MTFPDELARRVKDALGRYQNLETLKKIKSEQEQTIINIKSEIDFKATPSPFFPLLASTAATATIELLPCGSA